MDKAFKRIFENQQSHFFKSVRHSTVSDRIKKLKFLKKWIFCNRDKIAQAIFADFRKPAPEVDLTDIKPVTTEIQHAIDNLSKWMRSKKVKKSIALTGTLSWIHYEPAGVVLILAPWNFPFNLTVGPMVSAIAAGNCMVVKPSEFCPATSRLIQEMVEELFAEEEITVIQGDYQVAKDLLDLPFSHIFFTGSPAVGKQVMEAASKNLSSVTLELGGENPAIIDSTADLQDAAEKIAYGKFMNCGQSCLAPNFLMVQENIYDKFLTLLKTSIEKLYGRNEKLIENPDYGRIVNEKHFNRIKELTDISLKEGARAVLPVVMNEKQNFIAPVILENVSGNSRLLTEEIFGPILPVLKFKALEEVPVFIETKEKPLAIYIFSGSEENIRFFIRHSSAGTTGINEIMLQFFHSELPFGGANFSGIGKAHGHAGFLAFSNQRSILRQKTGMTTLKLVYPPYTTTVKKMINLILKYF